MGVASYWGFGDIGRETDIAKTARESTDVATYVATLKCTNNETGHQTINRSLPTSRADASPAPGYPGVIAAVRGRSTSDSCLAVIHRFVLLVYMDNTIFMRAVALRSIKINCSPAPDLML